MSSKIQKLNQELINKIATGEVVQRPYNGKKIFLFIFPFFFIVVKELVENSIDASSNEVAITLAKNGTNI